MSEGRNKRGRVLKGQNGKIEGRLSLSDAILRYGMEAPDRLREIADDPETPVKLKADIEKWFAEAIFGKPRQQAEYEHEAEMDLTVVRFEGDLDEWSG